MKLIVTHGRATHEVEISDEATTAGLGESMALRTGVPVPNQKFIIKGKSFHPGDNDILSSRVKNGDKVMMLGKRVDLVQDETVKRLQDLLSTTKPLVAKMQEIESQVEQLDKGFVLCYSQQTPKTAPELRS